MKAYHVGYISDVAQGYNQNATWKKSDPSIEVHESVQRLADNIDSNCRHIRKDLNKVRNYLDIIRRRGLKRGVKGWRRLWLEVLDTFRLL